MCYSICLSYITVTINLLRPIFLPVALVTQQASYIKTHTPLNVKHFFGEMGVVCESASFELKDNHILLMTCQIFLNMLSHGFISISFVNITIFDHRYYICSINGFITEWNPLKTDLAFWVSLPLANSTSWGLRLKLTSLLVLTS